MNAQTLRRLTRFTLEGLKSAANRRSLIAVGFALLAGAVGAELPDQFDEQVISPVTRGLGVGPAERVFTLSRDVGGGLTTDRPLLPASSESPAGALSLQSEFVPAGDRLRLSGRLWAGKPDGGVGVGLVDEESDSWMVAGVLPSAVGWRVALWSSDLENAVVAPEAVWAPAPGSWFRIEIEAESAYQLVPDLGLVFSAVAPRVREAIGAYVVDALTPA